MLEGFVFDFILRLPEDLLFNIIIKEADFHSLLQMRRVCKSWAHLFNNNAIWERGIIQVLGINQALFNQIKHTLIKTNLAYNRPLAKTIYFRLRNLQKELEKSKAKYLRCILTNKYFYSPILFAICTDYFDFAKQFIVQEEFDIWFEIAKLAKCTELLTSKKESYPIFSTREPLKQIDLKKEFELEITNETLNEVAATGNLAAFIYLTQPEFKLKVSHHTLANASLSGSLELVRYILNPHHSFHVSLKNRDKLPVVCGGNLAIINLLIADLDMRNALVYLKSQQHEAALPLLLSAHKYSPLHFSEHISYFINSLQNDLTNATRKFILEIPIVQELSTFLKPPRSTLINSKEEESKKLKWT